MGGGRTYPRPRTVAIVPIGINRDDEQRQITVVVSDPWSVEEIAIAVDRQLAEQVWSYGTLYDLRGSNSVPSEADVLWLVKRSQQQVARHGARGPVAVLLDGNNQGPLLRTYAEYGGEHSHLTVGVFDDPDAARQWLVAHHHP